MLVSRNAEDVEPCTVHLHASMKRRPELLKERGKVHVVKRVENTEKFSSLSSAERSRVWKVCTRKPMFVEVPPRSTRLGAPLQHLVEK